jgi:hypothetical protein
MKQVVLVLLWVWSLGIIAGCSSQKEIDRLEGDSGIARDYLLEQGYEIVSYKGALQSYQLTSDLLGTTPYSIFWRLPDNDPAPYMNNMIHTEQFIVRNHPLDHYHSDNLKGLGKTTVSVYLAEGGVIGGNSFPVINDDGVAGGYFGLNGEELRD